MPSNSIPWHEAFALLKHTPAVSITSHNNELIVHKCEDEFESNDISDQIIRLKDDVVFHGDYNTTVGIAKNGALVFKTQWDNCDHTDLVRYELLPLIANPIRKVA